MAAIQKREEHVGRGRLIVAPLELPQPHVVHDKERGTAPPLHSPWVRAIGQARVEVVNEVDAARVTDRPLLLTGLEGERFQDMAFASAALARDQQVFVALDEDEREKLLDRAAVELGLEVPFEARQGLAVLEA